VRFDDPDWAGGAAPGQPARVTVEREYRYGLAGELSDVLDRRRGWVQYDYDPAGRLLSVWHEVTGEVERFRYDPAGHLYDEDVDKGRVYGPGGRLLRRGGTEYRWDAAGRLIEKRTPRADDGSDVWRYTWDASGRLARVETPDGRCAEFAYDPFGRRVEAMLREARPFGEVARIAERTRFVWDIDTLAHAIRVRRGVEGDLIVEQQTFCMDDDGFVPWAQCDDTPDSFGGRLHTWSFFINDPIGTPEEMIGGDGGTLAEFDRRAWGRTAPIQGARAGTPLRFQGQHEDADSGLFYNRFRYYDPETGLYTSPDPCGLDGGLNPYAYVVNPTGWVDPYGEAPERGDLGGSGKPRMHFPKYKSRKCAKDAAGRGAEEHRKPHSKRVPGGQTGHFHGEGAHDAPRDDQGNELGRQDRNVHHGFGPSENRLRPGEKRAKRGRGT
jgi:RHS repeat-associated protein